MQVACKLSFDAAHILAGYGGKCGNLHGHTYKVEVAVERGESIDNGAPFDMVVDYNTLKPAVKSVVDAYDHAFLVGTYDNKSLEHVCKILGYKIKHINGYSSTENIAKQVFRELVELVNSTGADWYPMAVRVSETDSTYAECTSLDLITSAKEVSGDE